MLRFTLTTRTEKEDLHIKILRYALANRGFTVYEIQEGLGCSQEEKVFIQEEIYSSSDYFTSVGSTETGYAPKYMLSLEGRMRLLEYDELKEARQNAYEAKIMALAAFMVSVVGVVAQLF